MQESRAGQVGGRGQLPTGPADPSRSPGPGLVKPAQCLWHGNRAWGLRCLLRGAVMDAPGPLSCPSPPQSPCKSLSQFLRSPTGRDRARWHRAASCLLLGGGFHQGGLCCPHGCSSLVQQPEPPSSRIWPHHPAPLTGPGAPEQPLPTAKAVKGGNGLSVPQSCRCPQESP